MVDRGCLSSLQKSIGYLDSRILAQAPIEGSMDLAADFKPGCNDVVCSRGSEAYRQPGNVRLRGIIDRDLDRYANAGTKFAKSIIVSDIVDSVRASAGGRGFVRFNKSTKRWHVLSDKLAREKVGQLFRAALVKKKKTATPASKRAKKDEQATKNFMQGLLTSGTAPAPTTASLPRQITPEESNCPRAFMMGIADSKQRSLPRQVTPEEGEARNFMMQLAQQQQQATPEGGLNVPPLAASLPQLNRRDTLQHEARLQAMNSLLQKPVHQPATLQRTPSFAPPAFQTVPSLTPPDLLGLTSVGSIGTLSLTSLESRVTSGGAPPPSLDAIPSMSSLASFGGPPAMSHPSPTLASLTTLDRMPSGAAVPTTLDRIPSSLTATTTTLDRVPSFSSTALPTTLDRIPTFDKIAPVPLETVTSLDPPSLQRHLSLL